MTEFVKRKINVTINLGEGQYGEKKGKSITISGLRVATRTTYINAAVQAESQIQIFGLKQPLMNYLTGTGYGATEVRNNTIVVEAGDEGGALSTVYQGKIQYCYGDYSGAPDVFLDIRCFASLVAAVKPQPSRSYKGVKDAAAIMEELAQEMGLVFENDGVTVKLTDQHLNGTTLDQVKQCAQAANINYSDEFGKLVIWPKNGHRSQSPIITLSAQTGMVGYPAISAQGLSVVTLFNPNLALGRRIEIKSDITVANGAWVVAGVVHQLESEIPGGAWFSLVQCRRPAGA